MTATAPSKEEDSTRVLGVDACKKGWVGITNLMEGYFDRTISELVLAAEKPDPIAAVAVDIPIGLPVSGPRQADVLARGLVGKRASSVFATPVRAALHAPTHAEATAINLQAVGRGLSQQAYALSTKILDVDNWARTARQTVVEVHPEVCFAVMGGRPLRHSKSTWAGSEERRRLLAEAGIAIPSEIGAAGELAAPDDILDAAAVSWTALRYVRRQAACYPSAPEEFGDGHLAAIWA